MLNMKAKVDPKLTYLVPILFTIFQFDPNISIMLIWFLTFQYHVNLVHVIIFWMKIDDVCSGAFFGCPATCGPLEG